jgi:hypothetical protein
MDKRPQLSAKNKTDLMPNNALCKRWDTPNHSIRTMCEGQKPLDSSLPYLRSHWAKEEALDQMVILGEPSLATRFNSTWSTIILSGIIRASPTSSLQQSQDVAAPAVR